MKRRANLAMFMGFVVIFALGLGAMKAATESIMRASFALGLLILLIGTLGAMVRRRGAWVGFALFGWAYALVALSTPIQDVVESELRVSEPIEYIVHWLHPEPPGIGEDPMMTEHIYINRRGRWVVAEIYCARIGHVIAAMIFACIGAIAGHFLEARSSPVSMTSKTRTPSIPG